MNFRSCKYFLTVCEMGTINAAARKLYISPQSLSEHIRKMEQEVGAPLFHRDTPLVLTEAGECVYRAAATITAALDRMDREIAACKGLASKELIIATIPYGTPEYLPPIIELFLKKEPDVLLRTKEFFSAEEVPDDVSLLFTALELDSGYVSEVLFRDQLGVCVTDQLLKNTYGKDWRAVRERLSTGDLHALDGCPFVQISNTPMQTNTERIFKAYDFKPNLLPLYGQASTIDRFCKDGAAAMFTFKGRVKNDGSMPTFYELDKFREPVPSGFVCYRKNAVLTAPAQHFLELTRHYIKRRQEKK